MTVIADRNSNRQEECMPRSRPCLAHLLLPHDVTNNPSTDFGDASQFTALTSPLVPSLKKPASSLSSTYRSYPAPAYSTAALRLASRLSALMLASVIDQKYPK